MGRPKTYDKRIMTSVRLPAELMARVREAADDRELSVNYLICAAVEDFLPRLIPVDEIKLTR